MFLCCLVYINVILLACLCVCMLCSVISCLVFSCFVSVRAQLIPVSDELQTHEDHHSYCHPASCADGSCYCTNRGYGFYNGGGLCVDLKNRQGCECTCYSSGTSCRNYRCPDDSSTYMAMDGTIRCAKGEGDSEPVWHDSCYRTTVACERARCEYGEELVGCGRLSAGECKRCPVFKERNYWGSKGSCAQIPCTEAAAGQFVAKPCTSTADATVSHCQGYPGNGGHLVQQSGRRDSFYCPGGGVVLPLPENSRPVADYSNFECLPGYYLSGSSCIPCVPGSACVHGRKYECPANYYSSTYAQSSCILCTRDCRDQAQYPLRCAPGSTSNPGCVSCGACSYDPAKGMSCVMESYELQTLPDVCIPRKDDTVVVSCQTSPAV